MTILDDSIYVTHRQGIEEVSLTTLVKVRIISSGPDYRSLAPSIATYKNGLLFPDPQSHRILRWIKNQGRVEVFAGTSSEGNRDGLASRTEFYQLAGLCVEFDHVVYVCDARTSCIKVFTTERKLPHFWMPWRRSTRRSPFMKSMYNTNFAAYGRPPHWLTKRYNIFAETKP